jgi:hypothetical protein
MGNAHAEYSSSKGEPYQHIYCLLQSSPVSCAPKDKEEILPLNALRSSEKELAV